MATSSDDEHEEHAEDEEDEELAEAEDEGEHGDTIARRTRTKLSLVDVPIDALEGLLPDAAEPAAEEETEEDREYQRFLSSLLPQEQENLWFLDEEDEEYQPDDDEDDPDDPDAAADAASERVNVKISRKELTELLWDSTQLRVPPPAAGVPYLTIPPAFVAADGAAPTVSTAAAGDVTDPPPSVDYASTLSISRPSGRQRKRHSSLSAPASASANASDHSLESAERTERLLHGESTPRRRLRKYSAALSLKNLHGAVTQEQCVQLASQMHKHMQLLLQNYHSIVSEDDDSVRSSLVQCQKMINDLQRRADKAQRYKGSLLSKVNLGGASEGQEDDPKTSDSASRRKDQDALALRRVTRSLTAAHAAVSHPSMFELVGSQSIDELSAAFRRGCSVDERDAAMKEHMMELDTHLISTRRRSLYRATSPNEEALLAHGIRRFGADGDAWERIRQHFLPIKSADELRQRYKYLMSSKVKKNAVKTLNDEAIIRRKEPWLVEEDLRIARGLVELNDDKKRFYLLARDYLPHRSRTEIRKRWGRIVDNLRQYVSEVLQPPPDERSLEYVLMVKEYLELKLHEQAKVPEANELGEQTVPSLPLGVLPLFGFPGSSLSGQKKLPASTVKRRAAKKSREREAFRLRRACRAKSLHPALFFTSWSLISPAVLLTSTCEHNWPAFIEDVKPPPLPAVPELESEAVSAEQTVEDDVGRGGGSEDEDGDGGEMEVDSPPPALVAEDSPSKSPSGALPLSQPNLEDEPVPDFDLSEEDEDDSDYEHDELLSSENEDTESEFEQLELTDDDEDFHDDDFDDDDLDDEDYHDEDDSGSETNEERGGEGQRGLRHPLQLRNLRQPASQRITRALAALEHRMVSKAATPRRSSVSSGSALVDGPQKRRIAPTAASIESVEPSSSHGVGGEPGEAGEADEWADGSGDDGFECDELLESSDEAGSDADVGNAGLASLSMGPGSRNAFPNKKQRRLRE